ncbi:hypothetical protein ACHAO3_002437 [Verticillium nonalfalfae]
MDDFNITPKSANQDFNGLNPTGSLDRNVTPGFLAAQDLTYLGPVYSDYDNSRVSDYVDRSDMVSEYASDNDDNVRRVPELKGQYWPGMHLFDSATEEGKKKRNQRKDDSVIQRMRIGSDAINPTEMVTDMMMNFERYRHIDEDPSDDEVSPLKGSASKKKAFIHKPSVVSEHILKRRSKALATMGGRLSTPTKSTPRKSTPRKSTPRKYTPRKQAAVKTPSKKSRKARGQATTKVVVDKEGTRERRPKRGSATRAKSRIAAQAEQAEHDIFDDRDSIDQEFEIDSPDETPIKTKFKKETARRTTRNDSLHSSYKHSAPSTVESTTVNSKNEHGVYQDDGANLHAAGSAGVLSGGNLSASVSAMPTSGPESLATSPVTGVIKLDPAQESTDGQSYHFDDAMEAMGH